jgi:hypothetical protein
MSVLGPYVLTDCSERKTEASTTVGYVRRISKKGNRTEDQKTCLGLPYSQRGSREGSKHVPAPSHADGDDVAMCVVLHPFLLFHLSLAFRLRPGTLVGPAMSCFVLAVLHTIVGHTRPLRTGVLRGRKDRGRGDGPIRHGALAAMDRALAQAISLQGGGGVHEAHAS